MCAGLGLGRQSPTGPTLLPVSLQLSRETIHPLPEETGAGRPSRHWASLSRWQGGFCRQQPDPRAGGRLQGEGLSAPQTARDP